jgi:hypothetical protein
MRAVTFHRLASNPTQVFERIVQDPSLATFQVCSGGVSGR